MTTRERDIAQYKKTLSRFVAVYCRKKHGAPKGELCEECTALLSYGFSRLDQCPLDPKPKCKECPIHCYKPEYRTRIKEVMRFSGMYFVKRGRIDWLLKYFLRRS